MAKIIKLNKKEIIIKTIYIGGGTPSFIHEKYIAKIIECIFDNYKVRKDVEITIEVNPGTVTKEKLQTYKINGINRLSIGMQSTNNNILKQQQLEVPVETKEVPLEEPTSNKEEEKIPVVKEEIKEVQEEVKER